MRVIAVAAQSAKNRGTEPNRGGPPSSRQRAPTASALSTFPRATYRLQLREDFGFADVTQIAGYLAELGVSHVYLSPCTQAARGSTHGYDVVDPNRASDALGGEEVHGQMLSCLSQAGIGVLLDWVPNHLATATPESAWFWDLLEHGPSSLYAEYFDVEWDWPDPRLRRKILLPILGESYGKLLAEGAIRLEELSAPNGQGPRMAVRVYDRVLPIAADSLEIGPGESSGDAVARINGSAEALHELLECQHYRLAHWRASRHDLNYRRFFAIHELAGLRVEAPHVFENVHRRVLEWVKRGEVQGLRIDHIDGLRDPTGYLERLRSHLPGSWLLVEKILAHEEHLHAAWPVHGTTGYDFLNVVLGLFVDPAGRAPLTELHRDFTGERAEFWELAQRCKEGVLQQFFGSELARVLRSAGRVCNEDWRYRDHSARDLEGVLAALVTRLGVYRTYIRPGEQPRDEDVRELDRAIDVARAVIPEADRPLLEFVADILRGRVDGSEAAEVVARFQQLSGPVMAKGVEDTAFYRYTRLICLNEVGGDPDVFGTGVEAFHDFCARTQRDYPATLLATSTHDTKLSEGVRLRIAQLSEIPERWKSVVSRWSERNEPHRSPAGPDRSLEYYFYQLIVGAWPIPEESLQSHLQKAAREASEHTSWYQIDREYEQAVESFVARALGDPEWRAEVDAFLAPLREPARVSILAQTLLKLTAPGIPDLYQGEELWRHSLVDPHNRRRVDYGKRQQLLGVLEGATSAEILKRGDEGAPKLWLTRQALRVRARRPDCFDGRGRYDPLDTRGKEADRVVAFARGGRVCSVVPRLVLGLRDQWGDTDVDLPRGSFRNVLTGEQVPGGRRRLGELLQAFPVALLERD